MNKRFLRPLCLALTIGALAFMAWAPMSGQSTQVKRPSTGKTTTKKGTSTTGKSGKSTPKTGSSTKKSTGGTAATVTAVTPSAATGSINGHDYVDLGLSVKWATCNIGGSSPGDYGDYFSWGETAIKPNYDYSRCLTYNKKMNDISGSSFDAAHAIWGSTWRIPTREEAQELIDRCSWKWAKSGGHYGYLVTGPNGNSVFLSAGGYMHGNRELDRVGSVGYYWTSAPHDYDEFAYSLMFGDTYKEVAWLVRQSGHLVRPVSD